MHPYLGVCKMVVPDDKALGAGAVPCACKGRVARRRLPKDAVADAVSLPVAASGLCVTYTVEKTSAVPRAPEVAFGRWHVVPSVEAC